MGNSKVTWFVQDSWKPWSTYRAFGRYWKNSRLATTASATPSRYGWRKETARTAAPKSHRKATTHHRWSATKSLSQRPANDGVVLALTRSATLSLAVPVHHKAEEYLDAYLAALGNPANGPLFVSV